MFEIHCNQIVVMWLYGMTGTSKLKPEFLNVLKCAIALFALEMFCLSTRLSDAAQLQVWRKQNSITAQGNGGRWNRLKAER